MSSTLKQSVRTSVPAPGSLSTYSVPLVRALLMSATLAFFIGIALEHAEPLTMAMGLAPIAWVALEVVWHFFDE